MNFLICTILLLLCGCVGLILYAQYNQCDPFRAKLISKPDQVR